MNLQTIAVIFAIIIIPISLVLSAYIGTHIDTLVYQSQYDTKLAEATYDAVKAFQINTLNNQYSTISDSKIRDIEASVNVFFNSLGNNLGWGSYNENQVKEYVPALVYTLYDGYYIYSKYDNIGDGHGGTGLVRENQYGLKPYIYYTCRYKEGTDTDFVINYTLDNAVIVYGYINGNYVTRSGYLYNGNVPGINTPENDLSETLLIFIDDEKTKWFLKEYKYVYIDGTKVYKNNDNAIGRKSNNWVSGDEEPLLDIAVNEFFLYKDNRKTAKGTLTVPAVTEPDRSAEEYCKNTFIPSSTLSPTQRAALLDPTNADYTFAYWWNEEGPGSIKNGLNPVETKSGKSTPQIITGVSFPTGEYPLRVNSDVDIEDIEEHKRAIIQRSIKSNLYTAMANFSENSLSSYDYKMPEIDETEWDKVVGKVGVISFMQGIPMGNKYYNDYCIISNNNNKEFVSEDSIYIIGKDVSDIKTYHRVGCKLFQETDPNKKITPIQAYLNIDFRRQTVKGKIDEDGDGNYEDKNYYYYPQEAQACYNCIVSQSNVNSEISPTTELGKMFYRAYAREKYNLYKVNDYLNDT